MSKYFDGYASFKYEDMSKEKLISELKEKVRYIGQIKREHNDEIAKTQSARDKKIYDLETKLAEKDELLREKIGSLKTTDFIRLCLECGFMVDVKDKDTQDKISFAVEQLEKVKNNIIDRLADIDEQFMNDIWDEEQYARMCWENWDTKKFIDNLIKEIKDESIFN